MLRAEHNHFAQLWDEAPRSQRLTLLALADDPVSAVYSADYHSRHRLRRRTSTLQTALKTLLTKELTGRDDDGVYRIVEPFFAEWLVREQRGYACRPRYAANWSDGGLGSGAPCRTRAHDLGDLWSFFLHILAAIAWMGAGLSLIFLGVPADRARDPRRSAGARHTNRLGPTYFVPASLAVFVFGVILVIQSDLRLRPALDRARPRRLRPHVPHGLLVIKPRGERLGAMLAALARRDDAAHLARGPSPDRDLSRIDYVVLFFLVVFDMVVKPTGDDVGTLLFMAAVIVLVGGYFIWRALPPEAVPAAAGPA